MTREEIIQAVKDMSVLELNELVKACEEEFGVSAAAPVAARVLNEFAKTHKKLELKAAIIQGEIFDAAQVNQLASIPPRNVLIAKLLGSFKAPLSNFAYVLNSIKEQKESV